MPATAALAIVVAFGTRGDVQPLATLGRYLQEAGVAGRTVLVTHATHDSWLSAADANDCGNPYARLCKEYVPTTPATTWTGSDASSRFPPAGEVGVARPGPPATPAEQPDLVREVLTRLVGQQHATAEAASSGQTGSKAVSKPASAVVVFNLFALEAYHLAESLRLPAVAAAPYAIPYSAPRGFARQLSRELPDLHASLEEAVVRPGEAPGAVSLSEASVCIHRHGTHARKHACMHADTLVVLPTTMPMHLEHLGGRRALPCRHIPLS